MMVNEQKQILSLACEGQFVEAEKRALLFLQSYPNDAEVMGILAGIYVECKKYDEAVSWANKANQADAAYVFAHLLLAKADIGMNDWHKAKEKIQYFLTEYAGRISDEMLSMAYNLLAHIHKALGDARLAAQYSLEASKSSVDFSQRTENYSNYLFNLNYLNNASDQEIFFAHCKYDDFFKKCKQYSHSKVHGHRKIRIGYISPDLRQHVVIYFVYQLLLRYTKDKFMVFCYARGNEDTISCSLRDIVDIWRNISAFSDEDAAQRIYQDEIDILVDLSGHTKNNTLPILAFRPAPVQVSGIGYFNTTGLKTVDYFITDVHVDPPGQNDSVFTEKLLRLPQTHFCYTPPSDMPECADTPGKKNGHITFGSFNNFTKTTDEMLGVWWEILRRVPTGKLLLKSEIFRSNEGRSMIMERLKRIGFNEPQLIFRPETMPYLHEYHDVDIALDTFPYPGGATSCEALYMGVPVISLVGKRHGSRFGYSLLKNIGLEECIAHSKEEYIEKAVALAHDLEKLSLLHSGQLRMRMERSALMDGQRYVAHVESVYHSVWDAYLERVLPVDFNELEKLLEASMKEKQYELALIYAECILRKQMNHITALCAGAVVSLKLREYTKAIAYVQTIIAEDEGNLSAYLILAEVYWVQEKHGESIEILHLITNLLSQIHPSCIGEEVVEELLRLLMQAYEWYPENEDLVYSLVWLLLQVEEKSAAMHILEKYNGMDERILKLRDM